MIGIFIEQMFLLTPVSAAGRSIVLTPVSAAGRSIVLNKKAILKPKITKTQQIQTFFT
jgi:hypothetical protein